MVSQNFFAEKGTVLLQRLPRDGKHAIPFCKLASSPLATVPLL